MVNSLSIYIHWPFCKSKCPYCDFNSHVRVGIDNKRWQKALLRELSYYAGKLPDRQVVSIFFGGGTPSLMPSETVSALIQAVSDFWPVAEDLEITLEANPTSIEAQKFREFRTGGVNRVSVGVQSLIPEDLKFLGREHSVDEALAALSLAADIFPRMSFDMIYTRPNQAPAAWEKELLQALKYAKDHLSLYQLTIEENTAFHHLYHNGGLKMPEDDLAADMYMLTQDIMEAQGLPAYEISNHAQPGQESRHNLAYWRSQDYIGIGPGAHGRFRLQVADCIEGARVRGEVIHDDPAGEPFFNEMGQREIGGSVPAIIKRFATENIKSPERWLEKVEQWGNGLSVGTEISKKESLEEAIMMGLRLSSGIRYDEWQKQLGVDLRTVLPEVVVGKLQGLSLVDADENSIKVTKNGRLLLNRITKELLI